MSYYRDRRHSSNNYSLKIFHQNDFNLEYAAVIIFGLRVAAVEIIR